MSRKENPFQKERDAYEQIEIPDELQYLVKKAIQQSRKKRMDRRKQLWIRSMASVAAVLFLTLMVGVNSSYEVSKKVSKMPVVRSVAKVLTVRKYTMEKAADEELQRELAVEETKAITPEEIQQELPIMEAVEEEAAPQSSEEIAIAETVIPEEEMELQGYEKWVSELTLEKLDMVTELFVVEEKETKTVTKDAKKEFLTVSGNDKQRTEKELLSVSGNDEIDEEAPEEASQKISDTVLLAELPEEKIRLYGYHENGAVSGVALRVDDRFCCYDWTYLDARGKLPELYYTDADEDGEKEVLIFLYNDKTENAISENGEAEKTISENGGTEKTVSEDDKIQKTTSEDGQTKKSTSAQIDSTKEGDVESDTGKDQITISENNPAEENAEKPSFDQVSQIWIVSLSEAEDMVAKPISKVNGEAIFQKLVKNFQDKRKKDELF